MKIRIVADKKIDVHRNDGLRKRCGCARRTWPKCAHRWHFSFKWAGVHHRFALPTTITTKALAQTEADRLRTLIRGGTFPPPVAPVAPVVEALTFRQLGDRWLERAREGAVAKVGNDAAVLRGWAQLPVGADLTLGDHPIATLTEDTLEVAWGVLRARPLAASTRNKYVQTLKALQTWARRKGYLSRSWLSEGAALRREKGARRSRRLAPATVDEQGIVVVKSEEDRLLAAASPWLQRLILAALETGARRGELLALTWADVDMARGTLTIRAETTKTKTSRRLPISPRLRAVLALVRTDPTGAAYPPTAHVFGDLTGAKVADPKKAWLTAVLRAHGHEPTWVPAPKGGRVLSAESRAQLAAIDLHFHDLRHEAGSRFLEAGWPVSHVQQMLGHADLKQTSTYLNVHATSLDESMKRYGTAPALHAVAQPALTDHPPAGNAPAAEAPKVLTH